MKKRFAGKIIQECIANDSFGREFIYQLGVFNVHCELISRGVRHIAKIETFWNEDEEQNYKPVFCEIADWYTVSLEQISYEEGQSGIKGYYVYDVRYQNELDDLKKYLAHFGELNDESLSEREVLTKTRDLHYRIGKLFGYSDEAIYTWINARLSQLGDKND